MSDAVKIDNISVTYSDGSSPAIYGVSLNVKEGDFFGLMGPNGGGKSTLIKTMIGVLRPDSGSVEVLGADPSRSLHGVSYVPQFAEVSRRFPLSAREVVLSGLLSGSMHFLHRYGNKDKEKAEATLERVGLSSLAERQIGALSGGEFQRLLIARAIVSEPKLVILDEPTASVDPHSREDIYALLSDINNDGTTVVLATHDLSVVTSRIKTLACMNRSLVYLGKPEITETLAHTLYGGHVHFVNHSDHSVTCLSPEEHGYV